MNIIRNARDLTDTSFASEHLGIPKEKLILLRRAFDPALTAEEHEEIFPLDLGEAWDLAAFAATKHYTNSEHFFLSRESILDENGKRAAIQEWGSVHRQFSGIMTYATEGQSFPLKIENGSFIFQQSYVPANDSQRSTGFHTDSANERLAFPDYWLAPRHLLLHLRDIEPVTAYIKGLDQLDDALIDRVAMQDHGELLLKTYAEYAAILPEGDPALQLLEKDLRGEHLLFHDELLKQSAKEAGKLMTFPAGHIVACTDRTMHAGQAAPYERTQTFALAQSITELNF